MLYTELLSGIWISDTDMLTNTKFLEDNHISIILNCTQLFDFPDQTQIKKIRLPFSPLQDNNDLSLLQRNSDKITEYIHNSIDTDNILITCYDGISISPLLVALYIKKYSQIDAKSIYSILLSKQKNLNLWCDIDIF